MLMTNFKVSGQKSYGSFLFCVFFAKKNLKVTLKLSYARSWTTALLRSKHRISQIWDKYRATFVSKHPHNTHSEYDIHITPSRNFW